MIEIQPITPTYPIRKSNKIIREQEREADEQHSSGNKKKDDEKSDPLSEQHIDEIV